MASTEYPTASAPAAAPDEGGFFRRTLRTLGLMGRQGASTGMKTFGYSLLAGVATMGLGGLGIWGATAMVGSITALSLGAVAVGVGALVVGGLSVAAVLGGIGLLANSINFAAFGAAIGAVLAPSSKEALTQPQKDFQGPQVSIEQRIDQEQRRTNGLTAYYGDLQRSTQANQQAIEMASQPAMLMAAAPAVTPLAAPVAPTPNIPAASVPAPAAEPVPSNEMRDINYLDTREDHVAKLNAERAAQAQAAAADPTLAAAGR